MANEFYRKLPKVELHNHFDGACRLETLQDMCRKDNLDEKRFPYNDIEAFRRVVSLTGPQESLVDFLKPFPEVTYIISTRDNLKRHAKEFCEDQQYHSVIYSELRLCPHLLTVRGLTPHEALEAVIEGLDEGQKEYKVDVRIVLSFIKDKPEWSNEIVDMAMEYRDKGVVGVDVAGDELQPMAPHVDAFKRAYEAGLHITVHAGESGGPENVREAIEKLKATRIGHGYNVLRDNDVYQLAKDHDAHFEVCLTSSVYTNAAEYETHSVKQFIKDKVNFGLNTDDSGIISTTITKEYEESRDRVGMTLEDMITSVRNAARSCFLPQAEKQQLLTKLEKELEIFRNEQKP